MYIKYRAYTAWPVNNTNYWQTNQSSHLMHLIEDKVHCVLFQNSIIWVLVCVLFKKIRFILKGSFSLINLTLQILLINLQSMVTNTSSHRDKEKAILLRLVWKITSKLKNQTMINRTTCDNVFHLRHTFTKN